MRTFLDGWSDTWRRILTDAGARLLLVVAPILYSLFYPLPYLRELVRGVPVAVVDLDQSSLSRQLVRYTDAHETLRVAEHLDSIASAEAAVTAGRVRGYLVVPAKFRADVLRGREATVAFGGDATYFLQLKQVLTGFGEVTATLNAGTKIRQLAAGGKNLDQARAAALPVTLRAHPVGNTREGYKAYLIPGVFLLILQQTLLLGVGLVRGSNHEQTGGGPAATGAAVAGAVTAFTTLYLLHAVFHLGLAAWIYDLPTRGHVGQLGLFLCPYVLACVLFAFALSGCCARRETSIHLFLITSIPFLFLAGMSWPVESMPAALTWLARLVPFTAGMQGMLRMNSLQAQWAEIAPWWWLLWGLAMLFAWPAVRAWRRPASDSKAT
ncbi:ABC transporter permease [Opitutus sp. ER46]|uniref:ABC transporter permease n=1 Tax=Opitutus sp. ER46 TaxID=2161864 RepID=UPI000D30DC34|nr:ABC transporter permease [Opitutus sp. ER46]PTY00517.1 hypothetical protein DB354_01370 [Opitutus sp. ER46]